MYDVYRITEKATGKVYHGRVQGSGGSLRGEAGKAELRRAAQGLPVQIFDPSQKPPYTDLPTPITYVQLEDMDVFISSEKLWVDIREAEVELVKYGAWFHPDPTPTEYFVWVDLHGNEVKATSVGWVATPLPLDDPHFLGRVMFFRRKVSVLHTSGDFPHLDNQKS